MQARITHILRSASVFILLLMIYSSADAQYYSTGQDPASIRWKQLKTDHVSLIFPDYYETRARKLASFLDSTYIYSGHSLAYWPGRIPVIIHTQSAKSNAVVAWAPKRMEFYTSPPQDMYAQPWLEQLSIHEYRHVVQIDKLNQGPTKVISWFFGQQGTAAILGLYVPPWFLEGDAVVAETGLSYSGRGRVPDFEMKLRAQVLERGAYSYDKAVLGSYRDYIPDQYQLGYFLVAEGRRKYGTDLWSNTLDRVARRPYMVTPFQKGIRDHSGKRKVPFYNESLESLGEGWEKQDSLTSAEPVTNINSLNSKYSDYHHPKFINDHEVVALKVALDDIARFVRLDTAGNEEVIFTPGFILPEAVGYAAGKLCWAESRPDLRWSNRSHTVIRILDLEEGRAATINKRMRLYAPALNDDASRIVAVHADSIDRYSLVIIDAVNAVIEQKMPLPEDVFPLNPVWAGDDLILAVLVSENGKTLAKFDAGSGRFKYFLDWDYTEISQPVFSEPYIYFKGSWSGVSDIYALNIQTAEIHKVSSSRFGAADPHISEDGITLLYSDYSARGYNVATKQLDKDAWVPLKKVSDHSIRLYRNIAAQEEILPPWSDMPASDAPVKKYSRLGNLFNFHSWAPLDINASTYEVHPGVSIMSQNLLSSSFFTAGYEYNVNEQLGKVYASYSYQGWYPILEVYADYGSRREYIGFEQADDIGWHETNLRAGLRLPLNLSRGKYYAGINSSVYFNQIYRRMKPGNQLSFRHKDISSMKYGISIYRQIKRSFHDIYPRWGQSISFYFDDTPFGEIDYSSLLAGVISLYLPGILRHHGINLYAGYQCRYIGSYKFADRVAYPRGISDQQNEEVYSFRNTYAFPIVYPDWSIGPIIYLKRIRANLFYDHAIGWNNNLQRNYSSAGTDLLAEVHLLRFIAPFEFGVRYAYRIDNNTNYWAFLFSIGFSSFGLGEGK